MNRWGSGRCAERGELRRDARHPLGELALYGCGTLVLELAAVAAGLAFLRTSTDVEEIRVSGACPTGGPPHATRMPAGEAPSPTRPLPVSARRTPVTRSASASLAAPCTGVRTHGLHRIVP
ncbi:hypothetical protein GCM10012287_14740 [Streptomyces daqingensis]|uniref:Uncharacterized protein n=1 Tax=Streptomyces daqingensis TaxID=1472640 RepID=A0ABQ2M2C2_9ACTN|nr:hypothetical protein GCM10012287_14740 [Streptomyces daqingensis]